MRAAPPVLTNANVVNRPVIKEHTHMRTSYAHTETEKKPVGENTQKNDEMR